MEDDVEEAFAGPGWSTSAIACLFGHDRGTVGRTCPGRGRVGDETVTKR